MFAGIVSRGYSVRMRLITVDLARILFDAVHLCSGGMCAGLTTVICALESHGFLGAGDSVSELFVASGLVPFDVITLRCFQVDMPFDLY